MIGYAPLKHRRTVWTALVAIVVMLTTGPQARAQGTTLPLRRVFVAPWVVPGPRYTVFPEWSYLDGGNEMGRAPLYERSSRAATLPARYFGASGPGIDYGDRFPLRDGAFAFPPGDPTLLPDTVRSRLWLVQTRDCPRAFGSDPWPCLRIWRYDPHGLLVEGTGQELLAQLVGRPVLIVVQGYLTTPDLALGGTLLTQAWLEHYGALPADAVVIAFDWPSAQVYPSTLRDINERGEIAFASGYHLARFVEVFPPHSRVCLLGHSYGGRIITTAFHLLGGGALSTDHYRCPARLACPRRDLRLRGVFIAGSIDHHWLNPSEKLGQTLPACEAFLNLYNRRDLALLPYPFLLPSDHHRALGRVGLQPKDRRRLGPLLARYEEHDLSELLGHEHTLLGAVALPQVAAWIAPYTWSTDSLPALLAPARGHD